MTQHHADPDAHSVYDYESTRQLEGTPTADLVRQSLDAESGAVHAHYDGDAAEWSYVRADDVSDARARGEHIRVVYVMED